MVDLGKLPTDTSVLPKEQQMSGRESSQSHSSRSFSSEHDEVLHRILVAVERGRDRGKLELVIAIVLSLATLGSTWCGYQSGQWGGQQNSAQSAGDTSERKAAESTIVALQRRTQDGLVVLEFWKAMRTGDATVAETIRAHMNPILRTAVQASIDNGILTNPEAAGPLQRPEYLLPEEVEAAAMREEAARLKLSAGIAGQRSGKYVLLTLMFASVLFFGGIGGTFTNRRIRTVLAGIAVLLFTVTASLLLRLPVITG